MIGSIQIVMIQSCMPKISTTMTYAKKRFLRSLLGIPVMKNKLDGTMSGTRSTFSASFSHLHSGNVDENTKRTIHTSPTIYTKSSSSSKHLDYCIDIVRKCDYENYLATLLLPKDVQRAAFALRAFNVELSQVQDVVSEKQIGLMRIQFWKDSVNNIFQGRPPQKPVALELAGACGYYNLSKQWVNRIIEARTLQINKNAFLSVNDAEDFAEKANSSLYYLLLQCLGVQSVHADHAASHLGKAHGLVTLVRAVPFHAQRRTVMLPMDLMAKHKVSQEDVIRGKVSQPLKDVIFEVAGVAHQHLEKARSLRTSLPNKSFTVFLNSAVCDFYLKALQQADFDVFDGKLQKRNNLLALNMYINKLRKRY